jgi:antitoxin component of RelBE/YafQ-DinJ toxin-antitoxin module
MSTAITLFLDQLVRNNALPFNVTNESAEEIAFKKLQTELNIGIESYKYGNARSYDELKDRYGV